MQLVQSTGGGLVLTVKTSPSRKRARVFLGAGSFRWYNCRQIELNREELRWLVTDAGPYALRAIDNDLGRG